VKRENNMKTYEVEAFIYIEAEDEAEAERKVNEILDAPCNSINGYMTGLIEEEKND